MKIAQIRTAFAEATNNYFTYRDDCLDTAMYLRDELAKYFGLKIEEIVFAKPDAKTFEGFDHPHDAFLIEGGGAVRIAFAVNISGHAEGFPEYMQGIPLRIRKKGEQVFVETEWSGRQFVLGGIANLNTQEFCEYVFQEVLMTVEKGFDQIFEQNLPKGLGLLPLIEHWQKQTKVERQTA
jgi:hypothetical protein